MSNVFYRSRAGERREESVKQVVGKYPKSLHGRAGEPVHIASVLRSVGEVARDGGKITCKRGACALRDNPLNRPGLRRSRRPGGLLA